MLIFLPASSIYVSKMPLISLLSGDYLIGSIHGLRLDGVDYEFDGVAEHFQAMIDDHFGGDGMAFAKEYFRQLAWLPDFAPVDFIGHFDLCTKHLDTHKFFDTTSKEYRNAALEALI